MGRIFQFNTIGWTNEETKDNKFIIKLPGKDYDMNNYLESAQKYLDKHEFKFDIKNNIMECVIEQHDTISSIYKQSTVSFLFHRGLIPLMRIENEYTRDGKHVDRSTLLNLYYDIYSKSWLLFNIDDLHHMYSSIMNDIMCNFMINNLIRIDKLESVFDHIRSKTKYIDEMINIVEEIEK